MTQRARRLADAVDAIHTAAIVVWLGGFAFYAWFPTFRFWHAAALVAAGIHQIVLGNRCILTIISQRLRGETRPADFVGWIPKWLHMALTWSTVTAAALTLIFAKHS